MASDRLDIQFGEWVKRYFAPNIEAYCDILLRRIVPVFDDVEVEEERAAEDFFLNAAASYHGDDYGAVAEGAYEHARDTGIQFMEMRSVFLTTGVSGLFHLFERQLYKHLNNELDEWLQTPIAEWRDVMEVVPKFDHKWGQDAPCPDFVEAFRDPDLEELRLVANAVKHGQNGQSYRQLQKMRAPVLDPARLADDWTTGPFSVLNIDICVQPGDVERYRNAILRFWSLDGTFWAPRSAFK